MPRCGRRSPTTTSRSSATARTKPELRPRQGRAGRRRPARDEPLTVFHPRLAMRRVPYKTGRRTESRRVEPRKLHRRGDRRGPPRQVVCDFPQIRLDRPAGGAADRRGAAAWNEWRKAQEVALAKAFGDAVFAALEAPTPEARRELLADLPVVGEQAAIRDMLLSSDPETDRAGTLAALQSLEANTALPGDVARPCRSQARGAAGQRTARGRGPRRP